VAVEVFGVKAEERCRLVYVGDDGDVYESGSGAGPRKLTWGWSDVQTPDRLHYVWPSFSPDGSHVACFGVRTGAAPEAGLYAVHEDGFRVHEIWRMTEAAPVCESWSADSRHIALLLQTRDDLRLEIAGMDAPGRTTLLDQGAPLFWSWSPNDSIIAVHTGGSRSIYDEARLSVFDVAGGSVEELDRLVPGEFRTPTWSPDGSRLAYVDASRPGREMLAFYRIADGQTDRVEPVDGQTVMLWAPDGRTLAVAEASGDSPHVYAGLRLIDVATGATQAIADDELVSFFWAPCSTKLAVVSFDERSGMRWSILDTSGSRQMLPTSFYPSRELVYFCWFFDQFASSHPLISPDGRQLVFAGHIAGAEPRDRSAANSVYVTSLAGDSGVERVAAGHFACWDNHMRAVAA
jgi:Tol biopolymer transport system component